MSELCKKIGRKQKKSHGDHKAIEHGLENRLAVLLISSNILKYRISKNNVISCFQVLKSVSESKSNSWFMVCISTTLPSTGNDTGPGPAIRNMLSCFTLLSVLLAVLAKCWDLTLKRVFARSIHFSKNNCIQMLAKHGLQSQAHLVLMFQASVTFFSAFFGCQLRHRKPMSPFHLTNRSRLAAMPVADA